jgi:hypothetical protein
MAAITNESYRSFAAKLDEYRSAAEKASDDDRDKMLDLTESLMAALSSADLSSSETASEVESIMSAIGGGSVLLDDMRELIGGCALTIDLISSCIDHLESMKSQLSRSSSGYIKSAVVEFLGENDGKTGKSLIERIREKTGKTKPSNDSVYIIPKVKLSYGAASRSSFPNMIAGYGEFYRIASGYRTERRAGKTGSMSELLGIKDGEIADIVDEIDSGIAAKSGCPLIKAANSGEFSSLLKLIMTSSFGDGTIDDFYARNASLENEQAFLTRFSNRIACIYLADASALGDGSEFELRGEHLSALAKELRSESAGDISADDIIYQIMEYDVIYIISGMSGGHIDEDDVAAIKGSLESKISDMTKANGYISGLIDRVMADGRFRRGF